MNKEQKPNKFAAIFIAASLFTVPVSAQLVGQWDFNDANNGFAATVGMDLELLGIDASDSDTEFDDTDGFGVDPIDGEVANVMFYEYAGDPGLGYKVFTGEANGGGTRVNEYTLILDLFWDIGGVWRSIFQTDVTGASDGDFFVNPSDGIGISGQYEGLVNRNQWHRIAVTVSHVTGEMRKFIDGRLVGVNTIGDTIDGRWSLNSSADSEPYFLLFADESGETEPGYAGSIQFRQNVVPDGVIELLGKPTAAGIPQDLPVAQPSVSRVSPVDGSNNSLPNAEVSAIIALAGIPVDSQSIELTVDGSVVPATIDANDTQIAVSYTPAEPFGFATEHTASVAFSSMGDDAQAFVEEWTWTTVSIQNTLTPDMKADDSLVDTGNSGFLVRTIQLEDGILNNSDARAEATLAGEFDDNIRGGTDGWEIAEFINYEQAANPQGSIRGGEEAIPGLDSGDQNDFVVEAMAFVELEAGFHLMGVNSDDGFKVTAGKEPRSPNAITLGIFDGGRGDAPTMFNFFVEEAGFYAMRMIFYEDGGGASGEWWIQKDDGSRVLLNDVDNGGFAAFHLDAPSGENNPAFLEAGVATFEPANGASSIPAYQDVSVTLIDAIGGIDQSSIELAIGDQVYSGDQLTFERATQTEGSQAGLSTIEVSWNNPGFFSAGEVLNVEARFRVGPGGDERPVESVGWTATVSDYPTISADAKQPDGAVDTSTPGVSLFMNEIITDSGSGIPANASGAWAQLSGGLEFPNEADVVNQVITEPMDLEFGSNSGDNQFDLDYLVPGYIDAAFPNLATRFVTYLDLEAGYHRFGINRAGGAYVVVGSNPRDFFAQPVLETSTTGDISESTFDLFIEEAGLYGFRIDYWQSDASTNSQIEFYTFSGSVDEDGEEIRYLVNGENGVVGYPTSSALQAPFVEFASPFLGEIPQDTLTVVVNPGSADGQLSLDKFELNGTQIVPNIETEGSNLMLSVKPGGFRLKEEKHLVNLEVSGTDSDSGEALNSGTQWIFQGIEDFSDDSDRTVVYFEDFEGVQLEPNVDEGTPGQFAEAWTRTGPDGWVINNEGVPGVDSEDLDGDGLPDNDGVTEWAGWTFAAFDFWLSADGQRRAEFTLAEESTILVADPDEWDDKGHADSAANGWFETWVDTPAIPLQGVEANSAILKFDSSWRPEFDSNYRQSGEVTVRYDGGEPQQVLLWLSDSSSPFYKDDNSTNDEIQVPLFNPEGVSEVQVRFRMFDAGNDWWWAIDNLELSAGSQLVGEYKDLPLGLFTGDEPGDGEEPVVGSAVFAEGTLRVTLVDSRGSVAMQRRDKVNEGAWETVATSDNGQFEIAIDDAVSEAYFRFVRQ